MFCVATATGNVRTRLYYKTNPLPFLSKISFLSFPSFLQWNPSTNGTDERVSEVQELFLGKEKVSILVRCPYFSGLAIAVLGGRKGDLLEEVSS